MPLAAATALIAGSAAGAVASPFRPLPDDDGKAPRQASAAQDAGRSALPFARGRTFATLDDYLAFRRRGGAIDQPWYKEVAPDVFELQTTIRPAPPPERFTRAELARKFGFAR